MSSDVIYSR